MDLVKLRLLQVYTEALAAGWKHILDNSQTGTFKSHDAGIATTVAFGVDKLWYFTSHARNVTTETVERNYNYLDVRNSGMVWDYTPNGKPYLRWPKNGELPDTTGNCHRSSIFAALRNKNISIDEGEENPVCSTCHSLTDIKRSPTQIRAFLKRIGMGCLKVGFIPGKVVEEKKIIEIETYRDLH